MAVEGRMDFANRTNPFGASQPKKPKVGKDPGTSIEAQRAALALKKIDARQKHIEAGKCQQHGSAVVTPGK